MTAAYEIELADWRAARLAALVAEDGWLNLTDRVEIDGPGRWSVGSGEDADLRLSVGPERLGWLTIDSAGFAAFRKPNGTHWTFQTFRGRPPRIRSALAPLANPIAPDSHRSRRRTAPPSSQCRSPSRW